MANMRDLLHALVERVIEEHGGDNRRGSLSRAAREFGIETSSLSVIRRRLGGRSITVGHLDTLRENRGWSVDDMLLALLRLNAELRVREPNAAFVPLADAQGFIRREFAEPAPANDNVEPERKLAGD